MFSINGGLSEEKVLQNFAIKKNGLIIVVDKLQTGFDEPKLQTLFLDKEIRGINAIQTILRVNRTTKIVDDIRNFVAGMYILCLPGTGTKPVKISIK